MLNMIPQVGRSRHIVGSYTLNIGGIHSIKDTSPREKVDVPVGARTRSHGNYDIQCVTTSP